MGFECFGYVGGSPLIASNQSLEWVNERLGLVCLQLGIAGLIVVTGERHNEPLKR